MPTEARIITIPTSDAVLADDARRIAATIPPGLADADAINWYRLAVPRLHPTAVVRAEQPRPGTVGARPLWYVMRHDHPFSLTTSIVVPLSPHEAWRLYVDRAPEWLASLHPQPRTPGLHILERDYTLD